MRITAEKSDNEINSNQRNSYQADTQRDEIYATSTTPAHYGLHFSLSIMSRFLFRRLDIQQT